MSESILWYDLETFGTDPAKDRIAQCATLRTSLDLEELDEGVVEYVKPPLEYLPDPLACLITGIGPMKAWEDGMNEYRFFRSLRERLLVPATCTAGFNSIRFDNEFLRYGLWRNLFDPYVHEWDEGNSRWDLLDVLRAARDLRPEGITWPTGDDGKPSLRLELLTVANGIGHENAHDALADVRATIAMARLLKEKQPRFYDYCYKHRTKKAVRSLVDLVHRKPFVHSSGMLTSETGATSLFVPLAVDPGNQNCVLCYDLRFDPEDLIRLGVDDIRQRIFATNADLSSRGVTRIAVKGVHLNRAPFVAPAKILEEGDAAQRLGIDLAACHSHYDALMAHPGLTQKLFQVYTSPPYGGFDNDPDFALYEGFIRDQDRTRLEAIHHQVDTDPAGLVELLARLRFDNPALPELSKRFLWRNFSDQLDATERERYRSFCASRLLLPPKGRIVDFEFYARKIEEHRTSNDLAPRDVQTLAELNKWAALLREEVLSYEEPPQTPAS